MIAALAFLNSRRALRLVLLIAIALRLGVLFAFPNIFRFEQTNAIHGSEAYDEYAQNLLATEVYGRVAGVPDAWIPPGYSYLLATVYSLFGRGGVQVGIFHTFLDCLCILLVYEIGVRLFAGMRGHAISAHWVALGACLCYAAYPYLIFQNLTLIDTPLFMLILYAFLWVMIALREREALDATTWGYGILGGLLLGAGMMVRPILPLLALLIAVWFLFRCGLLQTILRLLPVALIGVAVVLMWTWRNYEIYGAFVPLTTTSGANFWQGNSEYTVPYFQAGYDVQWTAPEIEARDLTSREADAERFALAIDYLQSHTEQIPELLWVKFLVHWSIDIAPRRNPTAGELPRLIYQGDALVVSDPEATLALSGLPAGDPVDAYSEPLFDRIGRQIHRFYYGGLFVLCLLGMVVTARQWRAVSLLWLTQLAMTITYMLFHPSTRYRVPTDPLLFLFSAAALVWLWMRVQQRSTGRRQTP
ncbi:MAG: glycosyltransferase family 39 protein [Phototrophicaceae bacterium]